MSVACGFADPVVLVCEAAIDARCVVARVIVHRLLGQILRLQRSTACAQDKLGPFYFCPTRSYAYPVMIVLIDNYDSFTYNLVQKLGEVSPSTPVKVFRNDKVTADQIEEMR